MMEITNCLYIVMEREEASSLGAYEGFLIGGQRLTRQRHARGLRLKSLCKSLDQTLGSCRGLTLVMRVISLARRVDYPLQVLNQA